MEKRCVRSINMGVKNEKKSIFIDNFWDMPAMFSHAQILIQILAKEWII
jgi:hypothetical protein